MPTEASSVVLQAQVWAYHFCFVIQLLLSKHQSPAQLSTCRTTWLLEIVHQRDEAFFPSRIQTPAGTTDAGTGAASLEEQVGEGLTLFATLFPTTETCLCTSVPRINDPVQVYHRSENTCMNFRHLNHSGKEFTTRLFVITVISIDAGTCTVCMKFPLFVWYSSYVTDDNNEVLLSFKSVGISPHKVKRIISEDNPWLKI